MYGLAYILMHPLMFHPIEGPTQKNCMVRHFSYAIQLAVYILVVIGFDMNPLVVHTQA